MRNFNLNLIVYFLCSSFLDLSFSFAQEQENTLTTHYKICFIGDAGIPSDLSGESRKEKIENQKKVIEKMLLEGCHRVHYVGDIVYPRGISSANDKELCEQFTSPFKVLLDKIPFFMTLGNHDHISNPAAWLEVGGEGHMAVFPDLSKEITSSAWPPEYMKRKEGHTNNSANPSIIFPGFFWQENHKEDSSLKGLCIVSIDSSPFVPEKMALQRLVLGSEKGKRINFKHYKKMREDQKIWLKKFNEDSADCKLKIAVAHHPYHSAGAHGSANTSIAKIRYKKFLEEHVIGKFDYFITGHDHNLSYGGTFTEKFSEENNKSRPTKVFVSGAGAETIPLNHRSKNDFKTRIANGEKIFAAQSLGFISITLPMNEPEKAKFNIHYSDEGSKDWNTWNLDSDQME